MGLVQHRAATHRQMLAQHWVGKDCRDATGKSQILLDLAAFGPRRIALPRGQVGLLHHLLELRTSAGSRTLNTASKEDLSAVCLPSSDTMRGCLSCNQRATCAARASWPSKVSKAPRRWAVGTSCSASIASY